MRSAIVTWQPFGLTKRSLLFLMVLSLAACQLTHASRTGETKDTAQQDASFIKTAKPSPTEVKAKIATEVPSEIATDVAPLVSLSAQPDQQNYLVLPSPVPDPLRFVFPTPGPVPVSAWRPPLYPTPWAPTPEDHFYFARPIAANEVNWPLADYRYGGVFLPNVIHTGIDIPAPIGTPVLAAGSGRVIWAGYGLYLGNEDPADPYGLAVAIKHDFGFQGENLFTVYGHLSQVDVVKGQQVAAGDVLGLSGETGKVTGPHLHFEIRVGKNTYSLSQNPELWLAPPQGWGILVARIMNTAGEPLISTEVTIISKENRQKWTVKTYGKGSNNDLYYNENMVLGDLPAGDYVVWMPFTGTTYNLDIHISPGMVSYFTFRGRRGFMTELPPTPDGEFTPPVIINPPAP
jgi:murein DD-endopeptidase MepM/ murein hydrolase activator NlpD